MKINVLFILFTFIVIIILATSKDFATTAILVLLFANLLKDIKTEDIDRVIKLMPCDSRVSPKVDLLTPKSISPQSPVSNLSAQPVLPNNHVAQSSANNLSVQQPSLSVQPPTTVVKAPSAVNAHDIYGPNYENWNTQRGTYTTSYGEAEPHIFSSCSEKGNDVDSRNTLIWQKRTVDQQRNDGWASKDANYYKYHYAEEFDTEENLPWWGRTEW